MEWMDTLLAYLYQVSGSLSLHFTEICLPFQVISKICRLLTLNLSRIVELYVDVYSVGCLGFGCVMAALKDNVTISTAILKLNTAFPLLPSVIDFFGSLVNNHHLKELRLFGASLDKPFVTALHYAIYQGMNNLELLQFEHGPESYT